MNESHRTEKGLPAHTLTILIAALGGEGGGVLAGWVVDAANACGYPVQGTSIPGVAQRTGATTYYIELFPAKLALLGERLPVMPLSPAPGLVDVVVSSELLEAARAMLNGFVTAQRTALIASTQRVYTVQEKIQMGDGRYDEERILAAARELARRAILIDMQRLANEAGTVISAVMFGALAGSGELPLPRAACEEAIRRGGRGAEASLRGFALGFDAAQGREEPSPAPSTPQRRWRVRSAAQASALAERVRQSFPEDLRSVVDEGVARLADFQDHAYAGLYLDRLAPVLAAEQACAGASGGQAPLTRETARFLALWMGFEDLIRVADLKSRRSRFEQIRSEARAAPGDPVHVVEYLKPGIEELAAVLPPALSRALLAWSERHALTHRLNVGIYLRSSSISGFLMLRLLAALRPLRRLSARYAAEQALIERWLAAILDAARRDLRLALEIALCGRLIKGYGDTHRRGKENFLRILDTLAGGAFSDGRADAIRKAREAALADPEGRGLENSLAAHGIAPLPPRPQPIRFVRRPRAARRTAA